MNLKLRITNNTEEDRIVKLLSKWNTFKKDGVLIETFNTDFSYEKLINYLSVEPVIIKFISSTNNRQLNFYNYDLTGSRWFVPPSFRVNKHGVKCVLNFNKWNPEKFNIIDNNESVLWDFYRVVELNIKRKQVFEIEFIILDTTFTPPKQITKP